MPMKRDPSIKAIQIRVMPAFFDSGGLKAWTPLATASIPVSAAQPEAKALNMIKTGKIFDADSLYSGEGG